MSDTGFVNSAIADYQRDGFVVLRAILDRDTIASWREHLNRLQADQGAAVPIVTASLAHDHVLAAIAGDARLEDIAAHLLGADPIAFGCSFIVKHALIGLPARWHQDGYPWKIAFDITSAITLWVPLDPAGESSGGLEVIPGSHRIDAQPLRPTAGEANIFGCEIAPEWVDCRRAQQLEMMPGDVSVHHPNLIHGSRPNPSTQTRRALAVRYRSGASGGKRTGELVWPDGAALSPTGPGGGGRNLEVE